MCRTRLLVVLVLGATGCAAASRAAPGPPPRYRAESELAPAAPSAGEATDQAEAGAPVRVVLGARRERVTEIYRRYLGALARRDLATLRTLFDDPVVDADGGEPRSRDAIVEYHERFVLQADLGALAGLVATVRPLVHSNGDLRRAAHPPPGAMRQDDWLIEGPGRLPGATSMGLMLPRQMLVRWVDDAPRIVGITLPRRIP